MERRSLTTAAGLAIDFLKLRIFRSGDCFSEKTKNSPKPVTTNSVVALSTASEFEDAKRDRC